jgi:hypothetical protein
MRSARPILVAACLLGAGLAGPGCQAGEPGNCGRAVAGGEFRFCSNDGDQNQYCICSTGRCARDDGLCDTGFRYAYGDEACVTTQEQAAGGFVLSGGPTAACLDVPTPQPPVLLDPEKRVDPRLVPLADYVLIETVSPYPVGTAPIERDAATEVFAQLLDWNGVPVGPPSSSRLELEPAYGTAIAVRGAESWGQCDHGDNGAQSALFAHWVMPDPERPVLVRVTHTGTGPRLEDWTDEVLGSASRTPSPVQALRVVGTPDGCWVVWIEETDGPAVVRGTRVRADGSVAPVEELFGEPDQVEFATAPLMPGDPSTRAGLMAGDDGQRGVVAAVPFRNTVDDTVGLLARRLEAAGGEPTGPEAQRVAVFPDGSGDCEDGPCAGIEFPESGGIASQAGDEWLYFAFVLVGPPPAGMRTLFVTRVLRNMGEPGAPERIEAFSSPLRGATIVPRPAGGIFGAVMGWNGDVAAADLALHLFHTDADHAPRPSTVPAARAFLPQLAVDDHGYLMTGFLTMEAAGGFGLRLLRSHFDGLAPAPTWPADGVSYLPSGASIGSDPSSAVAAPLPRAEGGALVAWTAADLHVNISLVQSAL